MDLAFSKIFPLERPQWRQSLHNLQRLQAYGNDALEKHERIGWIAYGFDGVSIGIIYNATGWVGLYALALHNPFKSGLTVNNIIVSFQGDAGDGDVPVIDHRCLVQIWALAAKLHLLDAVEAHWIIRLDQACIAPAKDDRIRSRCLVIAMQVSQLAPCGDEGPKVNGLLHSRNARQFLGEIVGIAAAVVFGVQDAIYVVEEIFFGDSFVWISSLEMSQSFIRDRIAPLKSTGGTWSARQQVPLRIISLSLVLLI